jgi:hypothetical protein
VEGIISGVVSQEGKNNGHDAGVWGDAAQGPGFYVGMVGTADDTVAGVFYNNSATNFYASVFAQNDSSVNPSAAAFATLGGFYDGTCSIDVSGNLVCSGTLSGSNVTAAKRTVKTYGVQAAENWYEDYGSGQLQNGLARVNLDSTFGETVNTAVEYHVFLTPNGDCKGLYVANKTPKSFEVRELGGGLASVPFDYKIVAKRKGYEQVRLEDVTEQAKQQVEERQRLHNPRLKP